jgi:AraC-like DNA-binding protein
MRFNLQTLSRQPLVWKKIVPPGFKGVKLPGGTLASAQGEYGTLCIQEIREKDFIIQYKVFDIIQPLTIREIHSGQGIYTRLILKGNIRHHIKGFDKTLLQVNHLVYINTRSLSFENTVEEDLCITFDTFFTEKLVQDALKEYQGLQKVFSKNIKDKVYNTWADSGTYDIVYSILHSKYQKDFRKLYYENRIMDLLFKYLVLTAGDKPEVRKPGDREIKAIHESVKIIDADLSAHLRIPELAKMAGLSPTYYKLYFKQIKGVRPYEYLLGQRIKLAKQMLQQGCSVKEIAIRFGYRPSDFSTLFRQQTGFNPSHFQKRNSS